MNRQEFQTETMSVACPFCGSAKVEFEQWSNGFGFSIYHTCEVTRTHIMVEAKNKEDAVAVWDKRT